MLPLKVYTTPIIYLALTMYLSQSHLAIQFNVVYNGQFPLAPRIFFFLKKSLFLLDKEETGVDYV